MAAEAQHGGPTVGEYVCRSDGLAVRAIDRATRTVDFVASTDTLDSYDEIVEQNWDLKRYERNPVALWSHQSRELPIGHCTKVGMEDGQLVCTIKFATERANPKAEQVYQLILEESLRAVSVGFRPREVRFEKRDDKPVYVLSDNELHEISVVPIPANPDALAKMRAKAFEIYQAATAVHPEVKAEEHNTMTEAEQKAFEAKTAELALAKKGQADAETSAKALEAQNAKLVTERDAALESAKKAEDRAKSVEAKLVEKEVDALVGVKIDPAERENMVELATSNRPLFDKMISQRSAMPLLEKVVGPDPDPVKQVGDTVTSDGADFESLAHKKSAA